MVALQQAAIFVCLVSSWEVHATTGHKLTHEYLLVKKNMAENEGAFHYAKDSGNFGQNSNGKVRFGFF